MIERPCEAFLEAFGSESLVHQLLVDAGAEQHMLFSPVRNRRSSERRRLARAGRYWGELLNGHARQRGWDCHLLEEAFVDYWFLYTVINSLAGPSRKRGQKAFGFLTEVDSHLKSLGANFCPEVEAPHMPAQVLRHNKLEA